ncbi:MAG: permease [Candidatus Latescibacterota bacterium]|nr:permease [Candidatus Latescibacterota bacterium]
MQDIETDIHVLILSLLMLAVGPIMHQMARNIGRMLAVLDGFVFVSISGMVLLHIVPETYEVSGWFAILALMLGLFGPGFIEHRLHSFAKPAHTLALLLALLGISLHAFTDGLALGHVHAIEEHIEVHMLPMAVVLHRLPVGLMVWFLLRPVYGLNVAWITLLVIGISTILGFTLGEASIGALASDSRGIFQALVAGTLLHVVIHRSYPVAQNETTGKMQRWDAGMGALLGILFLYVILEDHIPSNLAECMNVFLRLAWESAPALLLAYIAAGLLYSFFPKTSLNWLSRGNDFSQAVRGMAFGLPLPVCSCGVVPVYRSLVAQGVPASAALSFMIATPELSIDAVLITLPLLGGHFTVIRVFCAVILALGIGWSIGRFTSLKTKLENTGNLESDKGTIINRLRNGIRIGLGDVVDDTAPWILLGLSAAALIKPIFSVLEYGEVNAFTEVAIFALFGIPTYVCASGATPLAAVLVFNGVSPGAALAFLLTGPATNLTTFAMLSSLHSRRIAASVAVGVTMCAVGLGYFVNILFPDINVPELQLHEHINWIGVNGACLLIVLLVFLGSLLRLGPRKFIEVASINKGSKNIGNEDLSCDEELVDCCSENVVEPDCSVHGHRH